MLTVYCLRLTVYCFLFTVSCSLFPVNFIFNVYCLLFTVYCLLLIVYCLFFFQLLFSVTVYCLLFTFYCLQFTVYCLLSKLEISCIGRLTLAHLIYQNCISTECTYRLYNPKIKVSHFFVVIKISFKIVISLLIVSQFLAKVSLTVLNTP